MAGSRRLLRGSTFAALAAGIVVVGPALAEPVKAGWTAYFSKAPGYAARVLDEVQPETELDLRSCEAGWC